MSKLYFMDREFKGHCLDLDGPLENSAFRHLFDDGWYWMHYRFLCCRDYLLSETTEAIQTHLYNFAAVLYKDYESIRDSNRIKEEKLNLMITELVEIAEYSQNFPVCLWLSGDELSREHLIEAMKTLPTPEQITNFMRLPHMLSIERERLPYRYAGMDIPLKRYRKELAHFNTRKKNDLKKGQREKAKAEQGGAANPPKADG